MPSVLDQQPEWQEQCDNQGGCPSRGPSCSVPVLAAATADFSHSFFSTPTHHRWFSARASAACTLYYIVKGQHKNVPWFLSGCTAGASILLPLLHSWMNCLLYSAESIPATQQ